MTNDQDFGGTDAHGPGTHDPPTGGGTGLDANVAGALSYVLGLFTGILFLVLEQDRTSVRYHAYQSIGFSVAWLLLSIVASILSVIPFIGWIVGGLLGLVVTLGGLALWLYLIWQAYQGHEPELPAIGPWARDRVRQETGP